MADIAIEYDRICFVDDEEEFLDSVRKWANKLSRNFYLTTNPHESIELVENNKIDTIISDLRMETMNGVELLQEIHKKNPTVDKYIITNFILDKEEDSICQELDIKVVEKSTSLETVLSKIAPEKENEWINQVLQMDVKYKNLYNLLELCVVQDLISDLNKMNKDEYIYEGGEKFKVGELIEDIRSLNARGREHILLWNEVKNTLKKLGKE